MNPRNLVRPWAANHRVTLTFQSNGSNQGLLVMLVEDGFAYTRFEWVQGLPPSFEKTKDNSWRFIGWNDMDAPTPEATLEVRPLEGESTVSQAA